jgi:hypothetical protein
MKLVEAGWVMIDGKRYWQERRSGTIPTPAEEFLEEREQAGENFVVATYHLLHSDVALAQRDREQIAFLLALLAGIGKRRALNELRRHMQSNLRRSRFSELKEQGITGLRAEEKIAAEEGTSVEALRKRVQDARRPRRAKRAQRSR